MEAIRFFKSKGVHLYSGLFKIQIGFKSYNLGIIIDKLNIDKLSFLHFRVMLIFWHMCFDFSIRDRNEDKKRKIERNDAILLRIGQSVIAIAFILLMIVVVRTILRMM